MTMFDERWLRELAADKRELLVSNKSSAVLAVMIIDAERAAHDATKKELAELKVLLATYQGESNE
jgi:hypothetical protein